MQNRVILDEDSGVIIHKPSGQIYNIVAALRVYFIEIRAPRKFVEPPKPDFARRGVEP